MPNKNQGYIYPVPKDIDTSVEEIPLSEYPRPNLERDSYLCLNGKWDFMMKKEDSLPSSYNEKIVVPFAVESKLSGIEKLVEPDDILFYERTVKIPEGFRKKKLLLHFDGVDQTCDVFINHKPVFHHVSGYTKFVVELDESIEDSFLLTLRVIDVTDESYHQRGKQRLVPNGWFYSSSSGVYFPVWMESVEENYVKQVFFTPLFDEKKVKVKVVSDNNLPCTVKIGETDYEMTTNEEKEIELPYFREWNLDDPYLYPVQITLEKDVVSSYFGMRKIEIRQGEKYKALYLNNKKIFLTGLLDQGYYFLGNLTPRSYKDYLFDIQSCKALGYNCLRKHIKIEEDLFYYYCDKEGMLVLQDFPCGGRKYKFLNTIYPRLFDFINDYKCVPNYAFLSRQDEEGRKEFDREMDEWTDNLYNYPSIVMYTIFNEGWGEFDPDEHYHYLKKKDPTRLYDSASGWYLAQGSDIFSIHAYDITHRVRKSKYGHPFMLSEIGGVSLVVEGHFFFDKVFGHHTCKTKEKLETRYKNLYYKDILSLKNRGCLIGAIYTQLSDCETEANGIYTFDRKVLKMDKDLLIAINEELKDLS